MKPILIAAFLTLLCPLPFVEATEQEPRMELTVAAKIVRPAPCAQPVEEPAVRPQAAPSGTAPRPSGWTARLYSRPPPL